ncbi:MAG: 1-acyl-sn-glycerol-3-phosphate acyltransferase [Bdellovibrionaceae bacterium]|nr:1-acyl-sn-glycerol-3-phosphate acyltransferase [Pseudobdellovibrionaceae bacterium]
MLKLLSYPRAFLLIPFIIVWTGFCSAIVLLGLIVGIHKEVIWKYWIRPVWTRVLLVCSGVRVHVKGAEKLPKNVGALYLFNHTSHYDIPVIFFGSPRFCNFGSKSELFSIPLFGWAIRMTGALEIERSNRTKVIQIYKEAEVRVKNGEIFALAPEGTRRPGHGTLGDFKSGPFFFAVNSHMPIIPLLLVGCEDVIKKHSIMINWGRWRTDVTFELLDPIYPDQSGEAQIPELKTKVFEVMQRSLRERWQQRGETTL